MRPVKVRVRGIYATALTALLLERFEIVEPSEIIQLRLGLSPGEGPPEVAIQDKPDRHGIVVEGVQSAVEEVVAFLKERIPWAVFTAQPLPTRAKQENPLAAVLAILSRVECEFPKPAKDLLDRVRAGVLFTIPGHHRLKTIDPSRVDEVEARQALELVEDLERELVWSQYVPGRTLEILHQKAGEPPIRQAGELLEAQPGRVVLRRVFRPGGAFDGLGVPKLAGDYGYVEFFPEKWWSRRSYFRAGGEKIGEIYNVQTPPEFLPGEIRYLDLELDLVRVGGEIRLTDAEVLERKVQAGIIPHALAQRAWEEAQTLAEALKEGAPPVHSP